MALPGQIESAMRVTRPPRGNGGDIQSLGQHILNLARADERREAEDRVLAAQAVQRVGGEHAGELLAMLGLEAS